MSTPREQIGTQPPENDLYVLLNVSKNATASQLRTAFRKLSQLYHPDKHVDPVAKEAANERFTCIKEAYEILSDEKLRSIYDEFGLANAREAASPSHELTPYVDLIGRFRAEAAARESSSGPTGTGINGPRDAYFTVINSAEARVDGTGLAVALEDGVFNSGAPLAVITQIALSSVATAYVSQDVTLIAQYSTTSQRRSASPVGVGELGLVARYQLSQHTHFELSAHKSLEESNAVVYAAQAVRVLDRFTQMSIKTALDPAGPDATTTLTVARVFDERRNASMSWSTGSLAFVSFLWRREAYDEFLPDAANRKKTQDDDDESSCDESETPREPSRTRQLISHLSQRLHNFVEPCGAKYVVRFGAMPIVRASFRRPVGSLFPLFEPCDAIGPGGGPSIKLAMQVGFMGWEVEVGGGERYVMNDTAWGMAVGCGSRGVVWKLRIERAGHRFVLPVVLVSAQSDAKSATMAAIFSSLLVTAIQSLIVRPIVKYREAEEKAEARERRAETLQKSQQEAEAAASLLSRQVSSIREAEEAVEIDGRTKAGLLVERAVYGLKGVVVGVKLRDASFVGRELEMEAIEVTDSVQALVSDSSVQVVSSTKSTLMGFWDPSALGDKEELALKVWYSFKGESHECVVDDMEPLELPLSNHKVNTWT